jgi:hypothetical protein
MDNAMTDEFGTPALVRHVGKHRFVLCEELTYPTLGFGTITVPKGFISDGASIPWALTWLFPRFGPSLNAAIVHDWLYWAQPFSRRVSDWLFREAMEDLGIACWRRDVIYQGVDKFGWLSWKKNQKKKDAGHLRIVRMCDPNWHKLALEMIR